MDEVFRIADKVTVFRDGKHVATLPASELDRQKLITLMVGRELTHLFPKEHAEIGEVVLSVRGLTRTGRDRRHQLRPAQGRDPGPRRPDGRRPDGGARGDLRRDQIDAGEILIHGKPVRIQSPRRRDLRRAWRCSPRTAS